MSLTAVSNLERYENLPSDIYNKITKKQVLEIDNRIKLVNKTLSTAYSALAIGTGAGLIGLASLNLSKAGFLGFESLYLPDDPRSKDSSLYIISSFMLATLGHKVFQHGLNTLEKMPQLVKIASAVAGAIGGALALQNEYGMKDCSIPPCRDVFTGLEKQITEKFCTCIVHPNETFTRLAIAALLVTNVAYANLKLVSIISNKVNNYYKANPDAKI